MSWENRGQAEGVLFGRYPLESAIRKNGMVQNHVFAPLQLNEQVVSSCLLLIKPQSSAV
jgi:hypothetical protein